MDSGSPVARILGMRSGRDGAVRFRRWRLTLPGAPAQNGELLSGRGREKLTRQHPPASKLFGCQSDRGGANASMHHPVWVVVAYRFAVTIRVLRGLSLWPLTSPPSKATARDIATPPRAASSPYRQGAPGAPGAPGELGACPRAEPPLTVWCPGDALGLSAPSAAGMLQGFRRRGALETQGSDCLKGLATKR